MIVKIRAPEGDNWKWILYDHVTKVSFLAKSFVLTDTEGVEIYGAGPKYFVMTIDANELPPKKISFDDVAFVCSDDGRTLETIGGC